MDIKPRRVKVKTAIRASTAPVATEPKLSDARSAPVAPMPISPAPVTPAPVAPATNTVVTQPITGAFAPSLRAKIRRRRIIIAASIILAVLAAGGGGAFAWFVLAAKPVPAVILHKFKPTPTPPTPTPTPVQKASPLTGLMVTPEEAAAPVFSVIIENHLDARPQSGLQAAGVVYEANAEGGITRFQAFYQNDRPTVIGPVRSLRTYFVDWGLEFNAPVAHAGGNADAMDLISPLSLKSLNGLNIGAPYFYRDSSRYAPHNFYTSSELLLRLVKSRGWAQAPTFTPSPRKADAPPAAGATAAAPNIHVNYSSGGYQVDYAYSATTNDYARSLAGAPHIDKNTGQQIHVKNIIVEMMPTSYGMTRADEQTVIMQTVGQGKAFVFRDGVAIEGTWKKSSHTARTELFDANGTEIALDAGNTWYSIVPEGKSVTY